MVDSDSDSSHGSGHPATPSTIRVLYVDTDDSAREAVASAAATYDDIDLVGAVVEATASNAPTDAVDCVVGSLDVFTDDGLPYECRGVPTILYTDVPPADVDSSVRERCDSFVQKQGDDSTTLLVEKIRGIVNSRDEDQRAKQFDRLVRDVPGVGVFVLDEEGHIEWSNVEFTELFPTESQDALAAGVGDFYARLSVVLGDDTDVGDLFALRDRSGCRPAHHVVVPTEDGERQYLHLSEAVGEDAPGERMEVFVDVTTVAERYDRLGLFEDLVDNAEDGLFVLDADGRVEYCNRSYAEMLGYEREELYGTHGADVMASGELERGQDLISRLMANEEDSAVVDLQLVTKTGDELDTSVHFSVRDDDGYGGVMGVVRDITERKRRERTLERYRTLVESAADPMYVLDDDGNIQICNRAMADFLGAAKAEVVGRNVREYIPQESLETGREALRTVLSAEDARAESFEAWLTDANGDKRLFEVTISAITEDDSFEGSVATFRDVTERHNRTAELDLRKQVFARSLRHNIRNETSVIHSYGSILAEELEGRRAEMADAILTASQNLARTSRKVNEFDWLVEKDTERVAHDLFPLVKQCIEQVRTTNETADVCVDIPEDVRVLAIQDVDIAIKNLVENALQHGSANQQPSVGVAATVDEETVTVSISDDGPGIPESEIEVIEESEETPLEHASGLGLWLVAHVVEKSGGDLAFDVADGTTVRMTLDRAPADSGDA